jgi:hypothetical protein
MAIVQIRESVLREVIKNAVVRALSESNKNKVNEAYFGDGGDDEEYQGKQNFSPDNTDYDLVYRLCDRFTRVPEGNMFDAVSSVWDYTKPEKENLEALKEYLSRLMINKN